MTTSPLAKRYFLRLSYDGTNFYGWQTQKNVETVQETIEKALSMLCRQKVAVCGCGRTDTGVHADDYYAHCDIDGKLDDQLVLKLNAVLPQSIAIKEIIPVDFDKNARYSATARTYHYYIHRKKNPFRRHHSYEFPYHSLDTTKMKEAADVILNYEEFLPLIKLDKEHQKTRCSILTSNFVELENGIYRYEIKANRFLHNMVRRIVGTLILIGREKLTVDEFRQSMDAQSPMRHVLLAPSNGLHLVHIEYPFLESSSQLL